METAIRKNFGKLTEAIEPPNLLQNQVDSFHDFLINHSVKDVVEIYP